MVRIIHILIETPCIIGQSKCVVVQKHNVTVCISFVIEKLMQICIVIYNLVKTKKNLLIYLCQYKQLKQTLNTWCLIIVYMADYVADKTTHIWGQRILITVS